MNILQLDDRNEFQLVECWVPEKDLTGIRSKLNRTAERINSQSDPIIIVKHHREEPGTFNRTNKLTKGFQLDPSSHFNGRSYMFGIDPNRQNSGNKIIFLNSFKMKISVIFGVFHMCFGTLLSAGTHLHFGKYLSVYAELVPELIYFACLFVCLVFFIFAKWMLYGPRKDVSNAPNIIVTFINMTVFKESPAPAGCPAEMYPNQEIIQTALVTLALLSVPWLFAAETVLLKQKKANFPNSEEALMLKLMMNVDGRKLAFSGEEFDDNRSDVGEIIIHQGIRTDGIRVRFDISHTASYLRIWALSLAHAELSDVLWKMVVQFGMGARDNTAEPSITVCFAIWAILTASILVLMEGLSAFLQTLRLHWVKFQSKFFSGSGQPFKPYSFENMLKTENDSDWMD